MTYGFGSFKYSIIIYTSSRIKERAISVPNKYLRPHKFQNITYYILF